MVTTFSQAIIDLGRADSSKRVIGSQTLARLHFHPNFQQAVPCLRKAAAQDPEPLVKIHSAEALLLAGEPIKTFLPILLAFVSQDTHSETRIAAIEAIGHVGPPANPAIPALLSCLFDDDKRVQRACFESLKLLHPTPDEAVIIIKSLSEGLIDDRAVNQWLSTIGRSMVPHLVALLKTPGSRDRRIAIETLCEIRWVPPDAAEDVLNSLIEDDCWNSLMRRSQLFSPDRRMECFFWFDDPDSVLDLALRHSHLEVRRLATSCIAHWRTKPSPKLASGLSAALQDTDEAVQEKSLYALMQIAHEEESHWNALLPQIKNLAQNGSRGICLKLIDHLRLLRSIDRPEVLRLIALNNPDDYLQEKITKSLHDCETDVAIRVARLVDILKSCQTLDFEVLRQLRYLRSKAETAVPALIELLKRYQDHLDSRTQLAFAFAQIAPDHDITRSLLTGSDKEVQKCVLTGMCDSDHPPESMIPILRDRLSDETFDVRFVAHELWKRSKDVESVVPALLRHLSESYVYECKEREIYFGASLASLRTQWHESIDFMIDIARDHVSALPFIAETIEASAHPHLNLRRLQWELFRQADAVIPGLTEELWGSDLSRRTAAIELLFRIGSAAGSAVATLQEQLHNDYYLYRSHALQVLVRVGIAAQDAIVDVARILDQGTLAISSELDDESRTHGSYECRMLAADALGELLPEIRSSVPVLKLIAGNEYVRRAIGWVAENESVDSLKALLNSIKVRYEPSAATAEEPSSPCKDEIPPVDIAALARLLDEVPGQRRPVLLALRQLGTVAASATTEIVKMLDDVSVDVRDAAISVLSFLGPAAAGPLKERLQSDDWIVRLEAAEALRRTGCIPAGEVPQLLDLLAGVDLEQTIIRKRSLAPKTHSQLLEQFDDVICNANSEHHEKLLALLAAIIQPGKGLGDCAMIKMKYFGQMAVPLLPFVLDALNGSDRYRCHAAICVIPELISTPSDVIDLLRPRLMDIEPFVHNAALEAIAEFDPSILNQYSRRDSYNEDV